MHRTQRRHPLAPSGLIVEHVDIELNRIIALARPQSKASACPRCGALSARVHSRYQRSLADLPSHGRAVEIKLTVRRLRCLRRDRPQQIFAERLDAHIAVPFGRRTVRMEHIIHHLGLALGGRPGHCLAERLSLPVSKDTLLRVVRRHAALPDLALGAVGIDDFAWRRGCRYGTVVCDLERRRIVALLADRQSESVAAWLRRHPSITFVARDRGANRSGAKGAMRSDILAAELVEGRQWAS